ncbi:OLC1v1018395C1 [Oldenlandia corymbosa var. corymbosa]|uniref:OLC1v1018395C1 n=1 Tax=Oldenlandia corymbosa var. corymbosa TaxID=529605 RepID=A0AAV1EBP8_OLDCO|nr:OLC1v1018395C1 [Oldenlandia corymbosa var. corymbosa]
MNRRKLNSIFLKFNFPQHWQSSWAVGRLGEVRGFTASPDGYSAHSTTNHLQERIVDALCLGQKDKASRLLSELRHTRESLDASNFAPILQCCARLPDPLFAMMTWKFMEEKKIYAGGKCYFYTIRALCKGGYLKEAFNLISVLRENPDMYPLLTVCNDFLSFCDQNHTINYVKDCLDFMDHQMVGKNELTYSLLLKLAVAQQNLPAVHEIWKECVQYYRLNLISMRKFIWSFTKLKDLDSAYETLQHMVNLAFQRNSVVSRTAGGKIIIPQLDIPIPSYSDSTLQSYTKNNGILPSVFDYQERMDVNRSNGLCNFSHLMETYDHTSSRVVPAKHVNVSVRKLLRWSFNDVIHACVKVQNCALAEQLMSQMQTLGVKPSSGTYDGFLRAVVTSRGFYDGMKVLEVMQQKKLKPHDSTLAAMAVGCCKALQLDLAEGFLDQISNCSSPHPYNAFLEACDTLDCPERAIQMLAKMKKMNIQLDIRTYELLFSLFGNVNPPYEEGNLLSRLDVARRVHAIEMDMMKNGIQHSHVSLKNMLNALGLEGMITELVQLLRDAEKPFSSAYRFLGTPIYNIVLHSLVKANETRMAVETFKTMKSWKVPPDAATYSIMIYSCCDMKCLLSAHALVSMMIRDGFPLATVTYTSLIKILLKLEDFDEALKLLSQMKLEGVEPDLILYNTFLQVTSEKGKLDVLELIVEQMHQEKIQPDPCTCHHVFSAYVVQGFHSTAMEALQVLSMRMISEDDEIMEEKKTEYQNLIVSDSVECETQIMELFKESMDYLPIALLHLRWCAMLGQTISWSPNQSPWAKRLSHNYASGTAPDLRTGR